MVNRELNIVVTGASGLLGRAVLATLLKTYPKTIGTAFSRSSESLKKLDLTDLDALESFINKQKPDVLIHCAAERRPDVADKDPEASIKLNVATTKKIFECMENLGRKSLAVYISTDYVFDGTNPPYIETAKPNPLNFYGKSKLQGEQSISFASSPLTKAIIRIPILYGETEYNGESAVNILVDIINKNTATKMDDSQMRYPTCTKDVAWCLGRLVEVWDKKEKDVGGIWHVSSGIAMTKFGMIEIMAKILQKDTSQTILPDYSASTATTNVSRPANAQLATKKIEELFKLRFITQLTYGDGEKCGLDEGKGVYRFMGFEDFFRRWLKK